MEAKRKIGLSVLLALTFLIYVVIVDNIDDPYTYEQSSTPATHNSSIEKQMNYYYSTYHKESNVSDKQKDEIFKTTIKGYRESSYWGSEHPIFNETIDMNKEELADYLKENYSSKDADLYWGTEY